ncbi:aminotransferase class I/II-fold pyridoxal phosphate-dependent enzyme [Aureibacillus halotolerans]|uniref:Lysine decarboxylase n=1 Tax=Aureibacillus halotolerans TaxID=1508390 RepID=A0A4V3D613_9BACI|nr:aminotransferase class I/II-fold pyridoxal phosphate-dependent enzyme [Aureibacillus halotolerans]TDQ42267.1 lysine decarboxylase [Aureibacillus halotolerans]
MSQHETPLFTGLINHIKKKPVQFHIPGHKGGTGADPEFREFVGESVLQMDLINIAPLDDLHHPKGLIQEAQQLAAEAFSADATYFSVQGTSGAIIAMVMSVCNPGDKIIVPRNVHKSVMSAIVFSGANPVFVHPELDETYGISHGMSAEAVQKAVQRHPDAKGLLVINPTYFGVATDLKKIVSIAHEMDIPVLVDEAHGVHIHFHEKLPLSAMQAGADIAATSMHKLGGSMTQSSILNVQGKRVSKTRLKSLLSMLTTTSTSYPLLASLDTARRRLAIEGAALLSTTIELAAYGRERLASIPGLLCPGEELLKGSATFDVDPTKLLISVKNLGISGYEAEVWLRENYQIEVELSDLYNILCIVTPGDSKKELDLLIKALEELSELHQAFLKNDHAPAVQVPDIPLLAISPREAFYAETELIPFHQSAGRIIAEFIMVYPPGIPIFVPGEIITNENLSYIKKNMAAGLPVQGPEDVDFRYLRVVKEYRAIQ